MRRHAKHDADHAATTIVNGLVTSVCGIEAKGSTATRDAYVEQCANAHIPTRWQRSPRSSLATPPPPPG